MKASTKIQLHKSANCAQSRRRKIGATDQPRSGVSNDRSQQQWELKHILVPTDFSKASKKALRYAVALAGKTGSQITLIHVLKIQPIDSEDYHVFIGCDPRLDKANNRLREVCGEVHVGPSLLRDSLVREGTAYRVITDAARELEADLIIIATNGRTGLAHA